MYNFEVIKYVMLSKHYTSDIDIKDSDYTLAEKHLYYLDLSSGFNAKFIGDKTVISNDLGKLRFGGSTLLIIKGNVITKS